MRDEQVMVDGNFGTVSLFRCPACRSELNSDCEGFRCAACSSLYPIVEGIIDFFPSYSGSSKMLQWAMEKHFVVQAYEDYLRPAFTRFFSKSLVDYDKEVAWLNDHIPQNVKVVLDLASGTGRYTEIISAIRSPEIVFAVDVSLPMLIAAKKRNSRRGLSNVFYLRADAHHLPFRDNSFDLTLCFGAMHLFQNPSNCIDEISRTTQRGGVFAALTAGSVKGKETSMAILSRILSWTFFDKKWIATHLGSRQIELTSYIQSSHVALFSGQKI